MAGIPDRLTAVISAGLARGQADVAAQRLRIEQRVRDRIEAATMDLGHVRARVTALSPQATLARGYAVVIRADGRAVRAPAEARGALTVYVAQGSFGAGRHRRDDARSATEPPMRPPATTSPAMRPPALAASRAPRLARRRRRHRRPPGNVADDMSAPGPTSADEPSYEAARAELAEVMKALESGGQSLEDSLELWKRGEELADICQRWLDDAGRRLDQAIAARTGPATTPPPRRKQHRTGCRHGACTNRASGPGRLRTHGVSSRRAGSSRSGPARSDTMAVDGQPTLRADAPSLGDRSGT